MLVPASDSFCRTLESIISRMKCLFLLFLERHRIIEDSALRINPAGDLISQTDITDFYSPFNMYYKFISFFRMEMLSLSFFFIAQLSLVTETFAMQAPPVIVFSSACAGLAGFFFSLFSLFPEFIVSSYLFLFHG